MYLGDCNGTKGKCPHPAATGTIICRVTAPKKQSLWFFMIVIYA